METAEQKSPSELETIKTMSEMIMTRTNKMLIAEAKNPNSSIILRRELKNIYDQAEMLKHYSQRLIKFMSLGDGQKYIVIDPTNGTARKASQSEILKNVVNVDITTLV